MNCKDIAPLCPLYLSGELDRSRELAFAEHLRACRTCASELDRHTRLDALLRDSVLYEPVDNAALEERIRLRISHESRFSRVRALAIAAGLGGILLAGGLGYRSVVAAKSPRIFADAAQDHHNEITFRQHRTWLSDPQTIADLARRNEIPPSLVGALAPPGYRLVEAKLCRLDGLVFLHLVYARGAREFSAYLRALNAERLPGAARETVNGKLLHEADSGHEYIASFQTGNLTAMFVTGESGVAALSLARFAARRL